jgi:penicillin-binding protein 1A
MLAMAQRKNKKSKSSKSFGNYIAGLWLIVLSGLIITIALFVLIAYSKLPDIASLENPKYEYASTAYDINNRELGKIFKYNRTWVTFDQIPQHTIDALMATEDIRYYQHSGIDFRSLFRAIAYLGSRGGASTISQQLAKLFFTERSRNIVVRIYQKMQEWVLATELEKRYTKQEILAMYLNKFDFLYNSHGIEAAANTYFGKPQAQLSIDEAAVLIGMLKNPSLYNPKLHPNRAASRRNVVLGQMNKYEFISDDDFNELKAKELDISHFEPSTHFTGPAPYFRAELNKWLKDLLDQKKYRKPDGSKYNIYLDGLKIYTTIDLDYQIKAEKAVHERMKSLQIMFDNVWDNKDPWTYGADKKQLSIRNKTLNRLIKESDRFQNIRSRVMNKLIDSIRQDFPDARLWDTDIHRMIMAEKDGKYLDNMLKKDFVTKKQVRRYKNIMASRYWEDLLSQQKKLNQEVKKAFNTKVRLSVFDYDKGSKFVSMTPIDSIKYQRSRLQTGMLAIEPSTGYIKSWVGGIDFRNFQFDHINSRRQVGSTFKPFIYTTAIFNQGISPCFKVQDIQYSITPGESDFGLMETWSPSNSDGKFTNEYMNLKDGLLHSVNSVSVYLMKELGNVDIVRDLVDKFGIDKDIIPRSPSICLGSADISVMEMTAAYSVFANNGIYNKPLFVTRIEDKNGKLIYQATEDQRRVLPEDYNYVMLDMLQYAARIIQPQLKTRVGGKTGTTNDYRDGWFMGVSPDLVVGTWVGGEDQWIRFRSIREGQGGVMARPIFVNFMKALEADPNTGYEAKTAFTKPEGELRITIDCEKYDSLYYKEEPGLLDDPSRLEETFDEEL